MSRTSKLTPERQQQICEAIRKGHHYESAARLAGICEATLYNWLKKGRQARSGRYVEFLEAVKKAEAEAEDSAIDVIRDQMPQDWKAAMTYLERRFPDRWARRDRMEHTGERGGPITIRVVYDDAGS